MKKIFTKPKYVAVIDIGSNSIKMSMAGLNHKIKTILEDKSPLRLLEKNETKISAQKVLQLNRTLERFVRKTRAFDPDYRVFATSAMRRAGNRKQVIRDIRKKWGLRIQVISGLQEAKYVLHAVEQKFILNRGHFCIVDIGGGSMELIQLLNGKPQWMCSIPFGSVVVKEKYCPVTPADALDFGMFVGDIQRNIVKKIPGKLQGCLIISGGTPSAVARIFQTKKRTNNMHGKLISQKDLSGLFRPLIDKPRGFWTQKYKISPSRTDLLVPCISTILALLRIAEVDAFQLSRTGLRQGVVAETFQKIHGRLSV